MKALSKVYNDSADALAKPGVWAQGDAAVDHSEGRSCINLMLSNQLVEWEDHTGYVFAEYNHRWASAGIGFCEATGIGPKRDMWGNAAAAVTGDYLPYWNDAPGMSAGYVVYMLRAAARYWHARGE